MKKCFFLIMLFVFSINLMAEDTIKLVNHNVLVVNIKSLSTDDVVYREIAMPDGPDFILKSDEIASITFRNGIAKTYNPFIEPEEIETNNNADISIGPGEKLYVSEDGKVKMKYNFSTKKVNIYTNQPMVFYPFSYGFYGGAMRTLTDIFFHFKGENYKLICDMINKVEVVAYLKGLDSWTPNVSFYNYFRKNMPETFTMDINYEMQNASHTMKLVK